MGTTPILVKKNDISSTVLCFLDHTCRCFRVCPLASHLITKPNSVLLHIPLCVRQNLPDRLIHHIRAKNEKNRTTGPQHRASLAVSPLHITFSLLASMDHGGKNSQEINFILAP